MERSGDREDTVALLLVGAAGALVLLMMTCSGCATALTMSSPEFWAILSAIILFVDDILSAVMM